MWYHLADTKPKARKDHQCLLCGEPIPKGTVHIARSGINDDGPDTFRMHISCEALTLKWDQGDWECHDAGEFRDSLLNAGLSHGDESATPQAR
jgi:hypothetical protein